MTYTLLKDGEVDFSAPSLRQMYAYVRDIGWVDKYRDVIPKPNRIVDVGASIGSTVRLWQSAFPDARITAVEPYPPNILYFNINCPDVPLLDRAAHDKTEALYMNVDVENTGMAHISDDGIPVQGVRLDDIIDECDFIKIDVEGHEFEVLDGAERLLKSMPTIVIESNDLQRLKKRLSQYKLQKIHERLFLAT